MAFQNDMANVQKVIYSEDKINLGTTIVHDEDHTLGNIVRMQLLRDKTVKFAGYRKPHPLENKIEIKCQTSNEKKPAQAIQDACSDLIIHVESIEAKFKEAFSNYQGQDTRPLI